MPSVHLTPAIKWLLIVNFVAFLVQQWLVVFTHGAVYDWLALNDQFLRGFRLWQPLTYLFLHQGLFHLIFNMLSLFLLGRAVEEVLGAKRFLQLYLATGVIGGIGWSAVDGIMRALLGGEHFCIGASAAVLGVVGAFAGLFPDRRISLLFLPFFSFTARNLAIAYAVVTLYVMMIPSTGGVAHAAHLFGMIAGYLYGQRLAAAASGATRRARTRGRVIQFPGTGERLSDAAPPSPADVDAILEKISREGMGSLTRQERRILDHASQKREEQD